MSDTYKKFNGSSWVDIRQVKKSVGPSIIDAQFVKKFTGSSWVDVWTPNIEIKDNDYSPLGGWYQTLVVSNANGLGYYVPRIAQVDNGIQFTVIAAANKPTPPVTTDQGLVFNNPINMSRYNTLEFDFTVTGVGFNEKGSSHGNILISFMNGSTKPPPSNENILGYVGGGISLQPLSSIVGMTHSDYHGCNVVGIRCKSIMHFPAQSDIPLYMGVFAEGSWGKRSGATSITFIMHGFKLLKA